MWSLFKAFVLLVAAVVLLDEDGRPATLLEALLLVVRPELGLDENGRLGHLLIQSVLGGREGHRDWLTLTGDEPGLINAHYYTPIHSYSLIRSNTW